MHIGQRWLNAASNGSSTFFLVYPAKLRRELSTDMESGRATVWNFNALFHADGDRRAKACLDTTHGVCEFGMVRHLLKTHLMTNERPVCIGFIELRFLRSSVRTSFASCVTGVTGIRGSTGLGACVTEV